MLALAKRQPGFIDFESVRDQEGYGITISYWKDKESIAAWKENMAHRQAQGRAKDWYSAFRVRVCRVEREYGF